MKVVFMGSPDFAVPSLDALHKAGVDIPFCITQKDAVSRNKRIPTAVKRRASDLGIEVYEPDIINKDRGLIEKMKLESPDFLVVAAFGQIISKEILEIPKIAAVNVHASLLPKYRGAAPIQRAVLEGAEETGVTIMKMAEGLDTGDMYSQASLEIAGYNYPELSERLAKLGAELLLKTMDDIESGKAHAEVQDETKATHTGIIKKEEGRVNFADESAIEIERKLRAFTPWPGVYFELGDLKIKIKAVEVHNDIKPVEVDRPAEVIAANNDGIDVICRKGVLRIKELQAPGKKSMKSGDYLRGNKLEVGTVLGR